MRRNYRNPPRKPGLAHDPLADQRRALESVRQRQRAEKLQAELPSLIEEHVDQHLQKLENKLLDGFKEIGQRAVDESAALLENRLGDRLETLEQISSMQSRTIVSLRDSSKAAEEKVSSVVHSIEKTLTAAVPGFQQEPSNLAPRIEEHVAPVDHSISEEPAESGLFCPNCTSTHVRRAYRKGLWEEMLRLFFLAPYRCRACRHRFYRF